MTNELFEPNRPFLSPYLRPSYTVLPHSRANLEATKVPFFIAVTPLGTKQSPDPIPVTPEPLQRISKCSNCFSYANSLAGEKTGSQCNICGSKISDPERVLTETQRYYYVYDSYFPRSNMPKKISSPNYNNMIFTLVVELSHTTYSTGIYQAILDKIAEDFIELGGYFTIFVYNNGIIIPNIDQEAGKFTLSTICDLDDPLFLPTDNMLLALDENYDLFIDYIEVLKKLEPKPVTCTVLEVMKALHSIAVEEEVLIPSLICAEARPGDRQELHEFASSCMRVGDAVDIFAIQQQGNDFSPLFEYSTIMSSYFHVYSQQELDIIQADIINRLLLPHFFDTSMAITFPDCLELVDIYGAGIRTTEKRYLLPSLCPNDTVYYQFKYKTRYIPNQISIQVQVRFKDTRLKRFMRIITHTFRTDPELVNVFNCIDFDVFIAGVITRGMSEGRVGGTQMRQLALKKEMDNVFNHRETMMNISRQLLIRQNRIKMCLTLAYNFLDDNNSARIFGKSPDYIAGFLAPRVNQLTFEGVQYDGEMLANINPQTGCFFVKGIENHSYVFIDGNQDFDRWNNEIEREDSQLRHQISSLADGDFVRIVSPSKDPHHPLLIYTYKLMNCLR